MSQNISTAVMQRRHEAHDSLDDFPTPPWATRALLQKVLTREGVLDRRDDVWEPACNRGYMASPLREYFLYVMASDIHDYGWSGQDFTVDFLLPKRENQRPFDWVITNPPFRLAEQFIERANAIAQCGVAMLVRTAFLESTGRYNRLFKVNPPSIVAQFSERVPMVKGRIDGTASTATAYCWLVWCDGRPTKFVWIPPCRKQLELPGDYEAAI